MCSSALKSLLGKVGRGVGTVSKQEFCFYDLIVCIPSVVPMYI